MGHLHFSLLNFLFILIFVYSAHTFQHPGVFVSKEQLYYVKHQVENKQEPFYTAYTKALSSNYSNLHYSPQGPPDNGIIDCGAYSVPDIGCSADDSDGIAAYLQSLLWVISGNKQYASNSINLLNRYASRLKKYNNTNAPVQAAWSALKWTRAAEIIRYSDAGWADNEVQAYEKLLQEVYLPLIVKGSGDNGNWELSMIEAMLGIAVFTSDSDLFTHAVDFWKQRVPAYYYYEPEDGTKPNPAPRGNPSWYNQTVFNSSVNGICQETCRDLGHTQMGTGSAINAAETAWIQGIDLYSLQEKRLRAALEFNTNILMRAPVPEYVCGGKVSIEDGPTFEVAYNHFHNMLGYSLPHTWDYILTYVRPRPSLTDGLGIYVWETLTHGGSPPK